jgi:alpha-D-ribose 1-methylphosphonate 5-triphosphate diphosphatase
MAYAAVKGGREAVAESIRLLEKHRAAGREISEPAALERGMILLIDRIMGEASFYALVYAALAHERGIPLASHDDDSREKLALTKNEFGVTISEFPIELEVAKKARDEGSLVVVGLPTSCSAAAIRVIFLTWKLSTMGPRTSFVRIITPASLLHAAFKLEKEGVLSLPSAVWMLPLSPAKAMGIDEDYDAVEAGKKADLLVVRKIHGWPLVYKCFIDGRTPLQLEYRIDGGENHVER